MTTCLHFASEGTTPIFKNNYKLAHGAGAMTIATLTGGMAERKQTYQRWFAKIASMRDAGRFYCCVEIQLNFANNKESAATVAVQQRQR